MRKRWRFHGLGFLPFALAAVAAVSLITMELWNNLMPAIFRLPSISVWQALGLLLLGRLFFGGFHGRRDKWNRRAKFIQSMTPEERERLRSTIRERCGEDFGPSEPQPGA